MLAQLLRATYSADPGWSRSRFTRLKLKAPYNGWSWAEVEFAEWRRAVDQRLEEIYAITIEDAGVDDEFLRTHWEGKEPPFEFVLWYGDKYDLDPKEAVWKYSRIGQ